jgi:hypothetical protein
LRKLWFPFWYPNSFPMASQPSLPNSDTLSRSEHDNATPRRVEQTRMRSSIACVRCRRSKVKCLNQGPGTPCRTCQNSGRECTYPEPMTDRSHRRGSADKLDAFGPDASYSLHTSKLLLTPSLRHLELSRGTNGFQRMVCILLAIEP